MKQLDILVNAFVAAAFEVARDKNLYGENPPSFSATQMNRLTHKVQLDTCGKLLREAYGFTDAGIATLVQRGKDKLALLQKKEARLFKINKNSPKYGFKVGDVYEVSLHWFDFVVHDGKTNPSFSFGKLSRYGEFLDGVKSLSA